MSILAAVGVLERVQIVEMICTPCVVQKSDGSFESHRSHHAPATCPLKNHESPTEDRRNACLKKPRGSQRHDSEEVAHEKPDTDQASDKTHGESQRFSCAVDITLHESAPKVFREELKWRRRESNLSQKRLESKWLALKALQKALHTWIQIFLP